VQKSFHIVEIKSISRTWSIIQIIDKYKYTIYNDSNKTPYPDTCIWHRRSLEACTWSSIYVLQRQ